MKTEQLLKRLREHQVRLKLESDKLICELPQQGIPAELRSLLIAHKDELKDFLRSLQPVHSVEIPSRPRQTHWPLSYAQNRLWLAEQMAGQESQYNSYFTFAVSGSLEPAALAQAFDCIVQRHESLRTGYALIQGQGQQWVYPVEQVKNQVLLEVLDGQELDDTALVALLRSRIQHRFKLDQDVLLRVVQVRQSAEQSLVMLVVHHIASDGWSGAVLAQEFSHFYRQALGQQVMELPELRIQYVDFACWQRSAEGEQQWRPLLPYWQQRLQNLPAVHQLPLDAIRPAEQNFHGSQMLQHLPQPLYQSLQHLAAQQGVTLFMLLHTVLGLLIGRLSAQTDVVIGVPVANRNQPELEPLIGFFVNTLVTRLQWQPDQTFLSLLQQNKDALLEDFRHQQMPFDVLVEQLQPERLPGIAPLFQILFIMQNNKTAELNVPAASIRPIAFDGGVTRFDLELYATEQEDGLELCWNYASSLFNNHTVMMLQQSYLQLLQSVLLVPEQQVSLLALVSEEEQQQLLRQCIGPQLPAPVQPVQHMFEAQARQQPAQTALLDDENKYSYQQLDQRANGLAHLLREEYQCQSGQLVAFCLPRGIGQISTMLAILKAGCCYMPLDPSLPDERLHQIIRQYPELLVLTDQQNAGRFSASALRLLSDIPLAMKEHPPEVSDWRPELPVYLLHTSGSTGQPKAIQMPHRALVNHLYSLQQDVSVLQGPNRSLHYASVGFDMSFTDIFLTLSGGGQLVLMDGGKQYDPAYLAQLVGQHQLSTLNLPYAMLAMLAEHLQQQQQTLPSLQCITVSAEQMKITEALRSWAERQPQLQLLNHYGPSETHVVTSWKLSGPPQQWPVLPPIGLPLANIRCYVLDAQRQLVPAGVIGELYLGGACLSSGYLGQVALTAERFVQDPFSTEQAAQMYQTGDLVRRRNDGVLEYIGRNDFQVKIRGFRIELGDVEAALRQCGVSECLALALADARGDLQLVAYYRAETELDAFQLQQQLARLLPAYMVPAVLVAVDAFVLNANGKIDRKALPAAKMPERQDAFIAPQSATEQLLAALWQEVLQSGPVSTSDNFFALGGHSLLVMNLVAKAQERQLKLDAAQVFTTATLAELAITIEQQTQQSFVIPAPAVPVGTQVLTPDMFPLLTLSEAELAIVVASVPGGAANIQDIYPLTALQHGFLFHHLLDENAADGYLQHPVLKVCGSAQTERLLSLLPSLFQRHDVLKTLILHTGLEQPIQVVCREHEFPVEHCVLQAADSDHAYQQQLIAKAPASLPLDQAPLVRILVGHVDGEESVYVLVLWHHIISDHVGVEIIGQELLALLEQQPLLPVAQYRDQISWMQFCRQQQDPLQYFRNELSDFADPALPFGLGEVLNSSHKPEIDAWSLSSTTSNQIRQLCRGMNLSPAVWFHMVWALVVSLASNKDDVVFGTVLSGRMKGYAGVERTAGLMINTLPIRFRLAQQSVRQLLLQVEKQLLQLMQLEQVPLVEAQGCSAVPPNTALFSALLNYRHTEVVTDRLALHGLSMLLPADYSNYPCVLAVDDLGSSYSFTLNVQTSGVSAHRVKEMVQSVLAVCLDLMQQDDDVAVLSRSLLPEKELQLLDLWSDTSVDYPDDVCIHQLFEAQIQLRPNAVAVVFGDDSLSYSEVNHKANQLAHYLIEQHGVGPDVLVGLCIERSFDMVIGILAILKAGGAYVPLDPDYPKDRLEFMHEDAQLSVVLSAKAQAGLQLPGMLCLDSLEIRQKLDKQSASNPQVKRLTALNLAYLIYTSGSTGRPKGVMVEHRALVNRIDWMHRMYGCDEQDRILQKTPFSFDVSVWEFMWPLSVGAGLVLAKAHGHKDPHYLAALMNATRVTKLHFVPSMLSSMLSCDVLSSCSSVRQVFCSGEALSGGHVEKFKQQCPAIELHNLYGPTEATIDVSYWDCQQYRLDGEKAVVPIGRPIQNIQLYVLSEYLQRCPVGVTGELYIGGVGLARGYLQRPDLTAERFIANPFQPGEQLYRTGDLVRFRPDGELEYLGRNDFQLKIRGYRIEAGEIEAALQNCGAEVAIVTAHQDTEGHQFLVGYYQGSGVDAAELKQRLSERLPAHLVPTLLIAVDKFALSANGKIDRKALPEPDLSQHQAQYESPQTVIEQQLAGIWQELLGLERVGRRDNFFELGGHSLLATRLITVVRQAFAIEIPLQNAFNVTELQQQACLIEQQLIMNNNQNIRTNTQLEEMEW